MVKKKIKKIQQGLEQTYLASVNKKRENKQKRNILNDKRFFSNLFNKYRDEEYNTDKLTNILEEIFTKVISGECKTAKEVQKLLNEKLDADAKNKLLTMLIIDRSIIIKKNIQTSIQNQDSKHNLEIQ